MQKKLHPALRILLTLLTAVVIAAGLIYFTGVVYFRTHFPFHTSFLGYDISQQEISAIDACMQQETDARTLTILERDGAEEYLILSEDVGYIRSVSEPAEGWIPDNAPWRWFYSLWEDNPLTGEVSISYNEELLESAVRGLQAMDAQTAVEPQSARVEWRDDICVIVPEVEGNTLYAYRTLRSVRAAIEADADTVDLEAENCYREPAVRSDNAYLNAIVSRFEAINFQRIEIDMTGDTIVLTPQDVLSYYTEQSDGALTLDTEAVAAFVSELKETYDTYERQRQFVNSFGNEITVGTRADTYGFRLDADATTELLSQTMEGHERLAQIEPVWTNKAWTREENGADIGDTYIEISIRDQYLWAYIDGEFVYSTSVVTGNTGNHDTPKGVFRILSMQKNATLVGEDYETPVSFWMALTWSGVGMHDASWRSSYGGNIYTYNGSHGCINMPYNAASRLYSLYYTGTPVVIW